MSRNAFLSIVLACLVAAPAHAGDQEFDQALQSYRSGRHSDAYGRFLDLAYRGDPDAARIVLFMGEMGPAVFGKEWELTEDDARFMRRVAARPSLREQKAEPAGDSTGRRHALLLQEVAAKPEPLAVRR
ncbi:MAG TPA: hypothetical protein VF522_07270 [Ramlibacter sp.]|uniref:hypothetical protein n=1 Tax=Ramlibacter sp. TaxID=1917967 RepID=UPI002ED39A00